MGKQIYQVAQYNNELINQLTPKIKKFFRGDICGNEPTTMVCKISGNTKRKVPFFWRLMGFLKDGIQMDEYLSKTEYLFYHDILPLMDGSGYLTPKIYFIGIYVFSFNFYYLFIIYNNIKLYGLIICSQYQSIIISKKFKEIESLYLA